MSEAIELNVFSHSQDAESNTFTKQLYRVLPPGVYHGMELVQEGDKVHVLAGVALVRDDQGHQTTVVHETSDFVIPTEDDNILLIDWEWQDDPDNTARIVTSSVQTGTDVVLGEGVFDGNGNLDSVNQNNRTLPTWTKNPGENDEEDIVLIPEINSL